MNSFLSASGIAPSFPFHLPYMLVYNHFTLQFQFLNSAFLLPLQILRHATDFAKCISLGYLQGIQALRRQDVYLLTNLFHQNS